MKTSHKATIAFSPGEYLKGIKVAEENKTMSRPIFAKSAEKESNDVKQRRKI
jgi:hypothetical protein